MNFVRFIIVLILIGILCSVVEAQPACGAFPDGSSYRRICEDVTDALCRILVLIQGIVGAIATFMLVWAGLKWIGSGEEGPQERDEAKKRIIAVIIGLLIVVVALNLINYLFGAELGTFECP